MPGTDHFDGFRVKCRFDCRDGNREPRSYWDPNSLRKHYGRVHNLWGDLSQNSRKLSLEADRMVLVTDKQQCARCPKQFDDAGALEKHEKDPASCAKSRHLWRTLPAEGTPEYDTAYADTFAYARFRISDHLKVHCDAKGKVIHSGESAFRLVSSQSSREGSAGSASQDGAAALPAPWDSAQVAVPAYQQYLQPADQGAGAAVYAATAPQSLPAGTGMPSQQLYHQQDWEYTQQMQPAAQMTGLAPAGMPQGINTSGEQVFQATNMFFGGVAREGLEFSGLKEQGMGSGGAYVAQHNLQAPQMGFERAAGNPMSSAGLGQKRARYDDYLAPPPAQQQHSQGSWQRPGDYQQGRLYDAFDQMGTSWRDSMAARRAPPEYHPEQGRQGHQTGYELQYLGQMGGGPVRTPPFMAYDSSGMGGNVGPMNTATGNAYVGALQFAQQALPFFPADGGGAAEQQQQLPGASSLDIAEMPRGGTAMAPAASGANQRRSDDFSFCDLPADHVMQGSTASQLPQMSANDLASAKAPAASEMQQLERNLYEALLEFHDNNGNFPDVDWPTFSPG